MEELHVTPEPPGLEGDGRWRNVLGAGDLSEPGAGNQPMEDGDEDIGSLEPVVGGVGLSTEGPAAVNTSKPLDDSEVAFSCVCAVLLEAPTLRIGMEITAGVGTEGRLELGIA
jgi:hypothetical protein